MRAAALERVLELSRSLVSTRRRRLRLLPRGRRGAQLRHGGAPPQRRDAHQPGRRRHRDRGRRAGRPGGAAAASCGACRSSAPCRRRRPSASSTGCAAPPWGPSRGPHRGLVAAVCRTRGRPLRARTTPRQSTPQLLAGRSLVEQSPRVAGPAAIADLASAVAPWTAPARRRRSAPQSAVTPLTAPAAQARRRQPTDGGRRTAARQPRAGRYGVKRIVRPPRV